MRIDGKFVDAEGHRPVGQYVSNRKQLSHIAISDLRAGLAVSAETMLWPHLPPSLLERTGLGGTHADSEHIPLLHFAA